MRVTFQRSAIYCLYAIFVACFLAGCGGGGSSSTFSSNSEYASLRISLGTSATTSRAVAGSTHLPDDITRCTVSCSGPGMTEISTELPLDGTPLIMSNIPPGINRLVTINSYNNQLLRLSGSATIANLQAGVTTTVSIQLADIAVIIISLDPIIDMATATDTTYAQIHPSSYLQLYSGVSNHVDTSVSWYVDGVLGGQASSGTISSGGLYVAPATIGNHIVQAVSNEAPTLIDFITIAVTTDYPDNVAPVADAGSDQTLAEGTTVNLFGSGSTDSDGTIDSYHWTQTVGTTVTLNDADIADPFFGAPDVSSAETLTFELTVTDNDGATDSDTVSIIVGPSGTSFTVSPKIVHLQLGDRQQFVATNADILWKVNGTEGGDNTVGTITENGLYSTPDSSATNPYDVSIEGIDLYDPDFSDSAKLAVVEETTWHKNYGYDDYLFSDGRYYPVTIAPSSNPGHSIISSILRPNSYAPENYALFMEIDAQGAVINQKLHSIDAGEWGYNWSAFHASAVSTPIRNVMQKTLATSDGGFLVANEIIAGSTTYVFLLKLNSAGDIDWVNQYPLGELAYVYNPNGSYNRSNHFLGSICQTSDNGYLLASSFYEGNDATISHEQILYFYRIDSNGDLVGSSSVSQVVPEYVPETGYHTRQMYLVGLTQVSDGGYLAAIDVEIGQSVLQNGTISAPLILKLNSDYSVAWCRQYSRPLVITEMVAGKGDDVYLLSTGSMYSTDEIIHLDGNGTVLTKHHFSSTTPPPSYIQLMPTNDGGIFLTGRTREINALLGSSVYTYFAVKADSGLDIQWERSYGGNEVPKSGYETTEGFQLATSFFGDDRGFMALKMSPSGIIDGPSENIPATAGITLADTAPEFTSNIISYISEASLSTSGTPFSHNEVLLPAPRLRTRQSPILTEAIARSLDYGVDEPLWIWEKMQFRATLSHLVTDPSVTWSVNGVEGGNSSVGIIDDTGFYTAPTSEPTPATVIIRATSVEEPSLSAETTLTITDGVD